MKTVEELGAAPLQGWVHAIVSAQDEAPAVHDGRGCKVRICRGMALCYARVANLVGRHGRRGRGAARHEQRQHQRGQADERRRVLRGEGPRRHDLSQARLHMSRELLQLEAGGGREAEGRWLCKRVRARGDKAAGPLTTQPPSTAPQTMALPATAAP
jgi:hypothetical protein